ncbi:hypothetical protein [Nonomuraea jabiensis]|uniref:C4-type Zn-finger protein n=1 Tax=Nonomuraea jabiensis TaxID=882448 RepID=A0A7W9LFY7_9ACTN|nr:hypothetical protein [Nonomuraea jabiensis]MBB5782263.1 C4-type Zn-finger protein [Nonomuraea jabiensis]
MEVLLFAPREEQHVGSQSVLCPVCQGVVPATGKEAYTPLRGRLIVTNGYCAGGCAERRAEEQAQQQTQQMVRPEPAVAPVAPVQVPVRTPLRVVR